jgi:hypothetical protein
MGFGGTVKSNPDPNESLLGVLLKARGCDGKATLEVPEQVARASPEAYTPGVGVVG